jgi:hypothetical protein
VTPKGRARIVAVPVVAGVLFGAVVAELETRANPIAAGVAAFRMLGDEAVERDCAPGLRTWEGLACLLARQVM